MYLLFLVTTGIIVHTVFQRRKLIRMTKLALQGMEQKRRFELSKLPFPVN
tara:strand:- start:828 stop:977 length:150 start_codon:yes stop_codon:yes gene_type:complete